MLTSLVLFAAMAATVPDDAAVEAMPPLEEAEVSVIALTGETNSTAERTPAADALQPPLRHGLASTTPAAQRNAAAQAPAPLMPKAAPIDREVPVITIVAPTAATITTTVGTAVAINGTATDDVGLSSVKWALTGAASTGGSFLTTTGTWSHTFPSLGVGTYTFRVTAVDTVGKPAVARTRTITITRAATRPPSTPPADDGKPETSGDIHSQKCGAGAGLATLLLLCGVVGLRSGRRRIE